MIDWLNLFYNSLWIFALALALATVSSASWQSSVSKTSLKIELAKPGPILALNVAGLLFSLGLALTTKTTLEALVWFGFAAYFLFQIAAPWFTNLRKSNRGTESNGTDD